MAGPTSRELVLLAGVRLDGQLQMRSVIRPSRPYTYLLPATLMGRVFRADGFPAMPAVEFNSKTRSARPCNGC